MTEGVNHGFLATVVKILGCIVLFIYVLFSPRQGFTHPTFWEAEEYDFSLKDLVRRNTAPTLAKCLPPSPFRSYQIGAYIAQICLQIRWHRKRKKSENRKIKCIECAFTSPELISNLSVAPLTAWLENNHGTSAVISKIIRKYGTNRSDSQEKMSVTVSL